MTVPFTVLLLLFGTLSVIGQPNAAPKKISGDSYLPIIRPFPPYPGPTITCPPGQFVVYPDGGNITYSYCKDYSKLGDDCSGNYNYCSPSLYCQYPQNVCVYQWEYSYNQVCDYEALQCPKYSSCGENSILILANGRSICCDSCFSKSNLGDYCDDLQSCRCGLRCSNNKCIESPKCRYVYCKKVTYSDCAEDEYFVPKDGINYCCDTCQKYLSLGDECDDSKYKYCNQPLQCQARRYAPNVCVYPWKYTYVPDCKNSECPKIRSCPANALLIRGGCSSSYCCDSCQQYSQLGQYCDASLRCYADLQCSYDKCIESPRCRRFTCPSITECLNPNEYLVTKDGYNICCNFCEKYAKIGEPCSNKKYCEPGSYCDYQTKRCTAGIIYYETQASSGP